MERAQPAIFNEFVVTVWLSTKLASANELLCLLVVTFMVTIPLFMLLTATNVTQAEQKKNTQFIEAGENKEDEDN